MKHKVVIEGVMKFTFSYSIESENAMDALDEGRRKAESMNNPEVPAAGFGQFDESPKIIYHVKEVKEEKDND